MAGGCREPQADGGAEKNEDQKAADHSAGMLRGMLEFLQGMQRERKRQEQWDTMQEQQEAQWKQQHELMQKQQEQHGRLLERLVSKQRKFQHLVGPGQQRHPVSRPKDGWCRWRDRGSRLPLQRGRREGNRWTVMLPLPLRPARMLLSS